MNGNYITYYGILPTTRTSKRNESGRADRGGSSRVAYCAIIIVSNVFEVKKLIPISIRRILNKF